MPPSSSSAKPVNEPVIETPLDLFMKIVAAKKSVTFVDLARELKWVPSGVERVAAVFEKARLLRVDYGSSFMGLPTVLFVKSLEQPTPTVGGKKILDVYAFDADFVPAKVSIFFSPSDQRAEYEVRTPQLGVYTAVFLQSLHDSIAQKIPSELVDISDVSKNKDLKNKFLEIAKVELNQYVSNVSQDVLEVLAGNLMHAMYGLGPLELLAADPFLEEIAVNSSHTPVTVYHRKYGWIKTNITVSTEDDISNYSSQIARKIGREITTLNPILDAHLLSGDRVNATLFPVSSFGNTITIRRFARNPWTIVDLIGKSHTMTTEMAAFLWQCIQYELSVMFAGGTASGKTATLNALSAFIPPYHRIISIEDVREITLPTYLNWNWIALTTRNPNLEGSGEVTMLDLMQASLRMRPDRLVLGEVRRPREAETLFEALQTGHSVYSTIHANSAQQVVRRLTEAPFSIPGIEVEAIDVVLTQFRDRRTNRRRTFEVAEVEMGSQGGSVGLNTLYRWRVREDDWLKVSSSSRVAEELNLHTGMTQKEIDADLLERVSVLDYMLQNNWSSMEQVGVIMKGYYANKTELLDAIQKKKLPTDLGF